MPNEPIPDGVPLEAFAVELRDLERQSGLTFFDGLLQQSTAKPLCGDVKCVLPDPGFWEYAKKTGKSRSNAKDDLDVPGWPATLPDPRAAASASPAAPASAAPSNRSEPLRSTSARAPDAAAAGSTTPAEVVTPEAAQPLDGTAVSSASPLPNKRSRRPRKRATSLDAASAQPAESDVSANVNAGVGGAAPQAAPIPVAATKF
eukprot:TRINITY_DN1401_c0_g1_i1.p1 TRINITY_DN1401_c0_g1~~TRINITY_DN1401_c0_g1_i1.p1  ORF type:complete len:203 (-),score=38.78 TRINITY_DN1401_c0_g1_i1:67-675(-)